MNFLTRFVIVIICGLIINLGFPYPYQTNGSGNIVICQETMENWMVELLVWNGAEEPQTNTDTPPAGIPFQQQNTAEEENTEEQKKKKMDEMSSKPSMVPDSGLKNLAMLNKLPLLKPIVVIPTPPPESA